MTEKQARLLRFISVQLTESGVAPSLDEMTIHLGLKSKSGTHRILVALGDLGHIVRLPGRARAIALAGHQFGDNGATKRLAMNVMKIMSYENTLAFSKADLARQVRSVCRAAL